MKDKWLSSHEGAKACPRPRVCMLTAQITDYETGATPFSVRAVPQQRGHEVELLGPQGCVVYIDEKRFTMFNKYKLFSRAKVLPLAFVYWSISFCCIRQNGLASYF